MTWLQGTTTWGNVETDLAKLICGEINDGVGANVGADAWVRDISTSYATLRTPSAADATLSSLSNRAGYWALMASANSGTGQPGASPLTTVCLQTGAISTSSPGTGAATHGRVLVCISVVTANTVASNYSTATTRENVFDADTGTSLFTNTRTPNSSGVITGYGGITYQITDPSGTLPVGAAFTRGFTTTYTYGIDWWPFYPNRTGTASFTTAPPGTVGTDYDIIDQVAGYMPNNSSTIAPVSTANTVFGIGCHFTGLGIKTSGGCTGAKYTISSITVADQKIAIVKSVNGGNGVLDLILGPAPVDSVATTTIGGGVRPSHASAIGNWLKFATTSGSVTNSMGIQYWMCVKPTGIVIALNADPGFSGKMGVAGVMKAQTVADATYDTSAWMAGVPSTDYTANNVTSQTVYMATQRAYFGKRRCQDSTWGSRDWQTGWMRSDMAVIANGINGVTYGQYLPGGGQVVHAMGFEADPFNAGIGVSANYNPITAAQVLRPNFDNTWWLYGFIYVEDATGLTLQFSTSGIAGTNTLAEQGSGGIRLTTADHFLMIPGNAGWGNGDELTDSVSGAKYLLINPDYSSLPGKIRTANNTFFGGVAIRENL
jgi:hypothetical protein